MFENIISEQRGRVGLITFNRPTALNALNAVMVAELNQALDGFAEDAAIGAVVLTGSAKAFAAGADIKEMKDYSAEAAVNADFLKSWDRINRFEKPIIAAVSGFALGGGCEFAMACDIIIAAETAKFGLPETSLGIFPGAGGTQRLVRAVGKSVAMEMILAGRFLSAAEAQSCGLVSRVVAEADLVTEALKLADKIASLSIPVSIKAKKLVHAAHELSLSEGLKTERTSFYQLFDLEDQKDGMAAFLEKRKPQFKNK